MAFRRRSRPLVQQGGPAMLWSLCRALALLSARVMLSAAALGLVAAGIIYLRLLQGPIAMPGAARMLSAEVNEASDRVRIDVGDVVLTLGEGAATSGLQFRDVEVRSPDGQQLLAVPRVGARFLLSDLMRGRLRPVRITLIEPDAQVVRTRDGRVRVGMGRGLGVSLPQVSGGGAPRDGFTAVAEVIDGLVGDGAPVPQLARLDRIDILGANLTFDDRRTGSHWSTRQADLRVWRHPGGARALLDIRPAGGSGAALSLSADRPAGPGRTDLRLEFMGIDSDRLASQARELNWLRLIGGTVSGEALATLERDGSLSTLAGVIAAEGGVIRGLGDPVDFDSAELQFSIDPGSDRLDVEKFAVSAPRFAATLAGYADLDRAPDGAVQGLSGQFDVGALRADLPQLFADPLAFDGGRVTARWSVPGRRIEVADARLTRGDLALTVEGEARDTGKGWITDLRAQAEGMTVDDLVAFWPVARSANARGWIDRHVTDGRIDRATAQMRLGGIEPHIALDFDYSGLRVDYVDGMSPVENGQGTGHVSFHDLFMELDSGQLIPRPGQEIELAGSRVAIRGFWGGVPPAEIALKARAPIEAALTMIDQPPLRLLSRMDRELNPIDGTAAVEVDLKIPLLRNLRLADIAVAARADLLDVATRFPLSPRRSIDLRSESLELAADDSSLRLSGRARIEGAPVTLEWREDYGPGPDGRTIDVAGNASEALLAAVGATGLPLEGEPPFDLRLRQSAGGPLAFTLDADLQPARVEIAALDWVKAPGVPARLHAEGAQRQGVDFSTLTLDSPGLDLRGNLRLDADGQIETARFDHVRVADLGTFAATLLRGPDGVLDVGVAGRQLDLSSRVDRAEGQDARRESAPDDDPSSTVRLRLDVDRLVLTDRLALTPGTGTVVQHPTGTLDGRLEGWLGAAPAVIEFNLPDGAPGRLVLTSPDAGAVLRAADLYSDAEGGTLALEARIGAGGRPGLTGTAHIEDIRVRSQSTFRSMLRSGGLDAAEQTVSSGGIGFRKVVIPFAYRGGVLRLDDAIASSPALALKVKGTVDARSNQVDLAGVLSPAYGLTGALNHVPLLGQILGGEGEGVLAMTFRMSGPVEDPRFSVNPLSLLAPGFLRKIFTAPTGEVSQEFRDNLSQRNR